MENPKSLYLSLSLSNPKLQAEDPNLKDPRDLIETFFHKLHTSFQKLFSSLPIFDDDEAQAGSEPLDSHPRIWPVVEDAAIVLRCCLVSLTLLHNNLNLLREKTLVILRALKALVSVDVSERCGRTVVRLRNFVSDIDLELSDSCRPFLCAVLEVFADELLRHQSLRKYIMIADSASSNEKVSNFKHDDDMASVLEVISTHFILSLSNEKAFESIINRLLLHRGKHSRFPELSVAPAISFLMDPIMVSAPKMFQVHIILLVSDIIGSGLSAKNLTPNMNWHLIAFKKSVILYSMHISSLQMDGFYAKTNCGYSSYQHERGQPTFESSTLQVTSKRLNQVLSQLDNSFDSYQCKMSSKTKADFLADCIAFMKGRQYIFADSCRDMHASILESIIHRAFSKDASGDVLCIKQNTSTPDIYLLASILKLMGVSLIQAIRCLSDSSDSGCLKTMGSTSGREKYDLLISHIQQFQQIAFHLPIQTFLYDVMKSQQTNCNVSKSMLMHFSGLLSLSFSSGLDLLAKGCIYVIMALMCLHAFEEEDLVSSDSLRHLPLQSCSFKILFDKTGEGVGDKPSIYKVAEQFIKIRRHNLRSGSVTSYNLPEGGQDENCNGEMFLDCILENPKEVSDYAELADFIECSSWKDYSSWLKGRERFRKWRYEKIVESRKNKKKEVWKSLKCQKNTKSSERQKNVKSLKSQKNGKFLKHRTGRDVT